MEGMAVLQPLQLGVMRGVGCIEVTQPVHDVRRGRTGVRLARVLQDGQRRPLGMPPPDRHQPVGALDAAAAGEVEELAFAGNGGVVTIVAVETDPAGRMTEPGEYQGGVVRLGPDAIDRADETLVPAVEPFRVRQCNVAAGAYQFARPQVLEHDVEVEYPWGTPLAAQPGPQLLRTHVRAHPFATAPVFLFPAQRRQRDLATIEPQRLGEQPGIAGQPEAVVPENQIDGGHARCSVYACTVADSLRLFRVGATMITATSPSGLNVGGSFGSRSSR